MQQITPDYTRWQRKAAWFLAGQTISMFGSSLVQFAIIWYITRTTNSGVMVTVSTVCSFLPQIFVSLFGGVWADRYPRKYLIIGADGLIALSTLVLALLMMSGRQHLGLIFLASAIRSLGAGVQTPAVNALIPQIVPVDKLMRINSINGSVQSMVNLVAPAVGGAVLSYGAFHNILFIDVVTAVIGISILIAIRVPVHQKAAETQKADYFSDLREGVQYALTNAFVQKLLLFFGIFTILIVPAAFLNVLMVTRVFGDSYWNLTFNEIAFFVGAVLGGIVMASWGGFKNRMQTILFGCFLFGVLTVAVGLVNVFWIYLVIMVLTGLTIPMFNSPVMVLLQEKVESNMQGRVFSLLQIVSSLVTLIGMSAFGPIADAMPIQWLMIGSGSFMVAISLCMLRNHSLMEEGLPEKHT